MSAVLAASCNRNERIEPSVSPGEETLIELLSHSSIRDMEIFLYEDWGIRKLQTHIHIDSTIVQITDGQSIEIPVQLRSGDYLAVALANCPSTPDSRALQSLDAIEALTMNYAAEQCDYPFLSGYCHFKTGEECAVQLGSLLCPVHIVSIDNQLEEAPLIQNPRVYFRNASAIAQVLRQDGFRPTQWVDNPAGLRSPELFIAYLPHDIGYIRLETDITLYCYPNDSPYDGPGTPRTELILEGETDGETLRFVTKLPAIRRGRDCRVALSLSEWNVEYP